MQVVFKGKHERSLPKDHVRASAPGFVFSLSENHWANIETQKVWMIRILDAFVKRKCEELQLPYGEQKAILLLDCWPCHLTEAHRDALAELPYLLVLFVPPNTTSKLQPCDVGLQKPLKDSFKSKFDQWSIGVLRDKLQHGAELKLDLSLPNLKNRLVGWLSAVHSDLAGRRDMLRKAWEHAGLLRAFDADLQREAVLVKDQLFQRVDKRGRPEAMIPAEVEEEYEADPLPVCDLQRMADQALQLQLEEGVVDIGEGHQDGVVVAGEGSGVAVASKRKRAATSVKGKGKARAVYSESEAEAESDTDDGIGDDGWPVIADDLPVEWTDQFLGKYVHVPLKVFGQKYSKRFYLGKVMGHNAGTGEIKVYFQVDGTTNTFGKEFKWEAWLADTDEVSDSDEDGDSDEGDEGSEDDEVTPVTVVPVRKQPGPVTAAKLIANSKNMLAAIDAMQVELPAKKKSKRGRPAGKKDSKPRKVAKLSMARNKAATYGYTSKK